VTSAFSSNSSTLWNSSLHGLALRVRASQRANARCASPNVLAKKAKPATSEPYSILPFDFVSSGMWVVLSISKANAQPGVLLAALCAIRRPCSVSTRNRSVAREARSADAGAPSSRRCSSCNGGGVGGGRGGGVGKARHASHSGSVFLGSDSQ